jgi:hypothetical protein
MHICYVYLDCVTGAGDRAENALAHGLKHGGTAPGKRHRQRLQAVQPHAGAPAEGVPRHGEAQLRHPAQEGVEPLGAARGRSRSGSEPLGVRPISEPLGVRPI